ncbi:VOC family protein [Plantactinospora sp. CA-294935]|uniref:VOC family protein n=1 Tax=Plantactinospora sp. CA-294935 TaxID=3240012 RepID=UPI003D8B5628
MSGEQRQAGRHPGEQPVRPGRCRPVSPVALGVRRIMFAVDDIEDVVARLRTHGAELVGELAQYEDSYRLCYVRGPEGIIVGLAEQLG